MVRFLIALLAMVPIAILLLPAFAIAVGLIAFAGCVRLLARLIERRFVPWTDLITFDARLGWKPKPNLEVCYLAEHDDVFRMVTDEEGWPGRRPLDERDVVVIGDSFAFGYGVDAGRSFAEVDPALSVKAVGAPGYSMVHGVLLMEQLESRLRGKLVVWLVFLENDLQDNLAPEMRRYRAPFVRPRHADGTWEIVADHVSPAPWTSSDLDRRRLFPRLCVPGPLADRAYAACHYLIGRAAASCRRAGAQLAVVTVPDLAQLTASGIARLAARSGDPDLCDPDFPDARLADSCGRHGVPMLRGRRHLSAADYKRREGIHWNEQGHRRMAALIGRMYAAFQSNTLESLVPRQPVATETSGTSAPGAAAFVPGTNRWEISGALNSRR